MRPHNILWASLLAAGLTLPFASPSFANIVITIDKSTQHMLVAVDGATRYDWPVSTGRPGYDTPNGTFRPNRMEAEHFSKEYENAPMPHSIFFDMKGHAIHGFFDTPHLGLAVSHGCVRLSPANAATLFSLVKDETMAGTTVIITGRAPARNAPLVAQRRAPTQEAATAPPTQLSPYPSQQPYGPPAYDQYNRSGFPPQPRSSYDQPAYNQPYGGGQTYYRQPYGPPAYQQPQYSGPYSRY